MTPFMYAILIRSYQAAFTFLNTTAAIMHESYSRTISEKSDGELSEAESDVKNKAVDSLVMDYLFPSGSHPDDSPLFILCLNDVCTYTWTGACKFGINLMGETISVKSVFIFMSTFIIPAGHIQQDVWECRTCQLVGTLCCCTECARTCHRGHDCKIKRSSPTAYCDCWEKSKCQCLVSGDEKIRLELFSKLVSMSTDLIVRPNSK